MELRVCDEIMQVQSPRREILSFKLISEDAVAHGKAELFASLARVMHAPAPSITAPTPLYHLLPLDRFQSRIEPFVTVERELWRLFILVRALRVGFHIRSCSRRSIGALEITTRLVRPIT